MYLLNLQTEVLSFKSWLCFLPGNKSKKLLIPNLDRWRDSSYPIVWPNIVAVLRTELMGNFPVKDGHQSPCRAGSRVRSPARSTPAPWRRNQELTSPLLIHWPDWYIGSAVAIQQHFSKSKSIILASIDDQEPPLSIGSVDNVSEVCVQVKWGIVK